MSEQRHTEFNLVTESAMKYLAAPHTIPSAESLDRWRICLLLWSYPAFAESRSWAVYQRHEAGSRLVRTLVRQVTWDRPGDAERLFKPLAGLEKGFHVQPTIEVRDRPIDSLIFQKCLKTLSSISFPAFASHGIGIDGVSFGVTSATKGASVEWWCEGPSSWQELTSWAAQTREWFMSTTVQSPDYSLWQPPSPKLP